MILEDKIGIANVKGLLQKTDDQILRIKFLEVIKLILIYKTVEFNCLKQKTYLFGLIKNAFGYFFFNGARFLSASILVLKFPTHTL